ncbi:MAG: signal recognition particle-docking protein FtsY [Microcoleaceae cyanobacterium]
MVFNWFRRQPDQDKQSAQPSPTPDPAPAQPQTSESESQSGSASEDYLKWAKAAYQNIQQKQQDEPAAQTQPDQTTEPNAVESDEDSSVQVFDSPETEITDEGAATGEADIESASAPTATTEEAGIRATSGQPAREQQAEAEPVEPLETLPEEPAVPTSTESEATVPFWAKAEAERQARIERLKQTAIEEPEPEPEPIISIDSDAPPIVFDERFLWSAEVLASQGRRPDEVTLEEITWLQKLRQGLGRTRRGLLNQLRSIVGQGPLNQDAVEEIEALLLQADVGIEATDTVVEALQERLRQDALPPEQAIAYLKQVLRELLEQPYQKGYAPTFAPEKEQLNIWLITGVNGAGKTTTIGKIAHLANKSGYDCLIGAADTFRAAAVEQVKVWGQRSGVDVIANPGQNTDPAAVVFDAISAAKSRGTELLLLDTAGRLQNKKNLMEELNKIRRVITKQAPDAVIESLLVLDATLGQNGLRQAEVFAEVAQLSGVIFTKLDGTAKGGVSLGVVQQLGLPIRFIGVGESIEDLRPFSSYEFIEALLSG